MSYITEKKESIKIMDRLRDRRVSMAVFCTASHWNTEAILLAADRFAEKHKIESIPVTVAMTYDYIHMPQARRVTYSKDARTGFLSIMEHLRILCKDKDSPYNRVTVLPHLDHADPARDGWALTDGLDYLASVMFDAQKYPIEQNMELTTGYVKRYGDRIMIEGIMDELSVKGNMAAYDENYVEKASDYVRKTKVDFLVANLGTEQQSNSRGKCEYLKQRAQNLTGIFKKAILVLHGTSSLSVEQMQGLPDDGVARVNMWTRIAREAGQYAAEELFKNARNIFTGDFEACESRAYLGNSIEKAADIMEETLYILGYSRLAD